MADNQLKPFSIKLNAQHDNGMTHFDFTTWSHGGKISKN